MHVSRLLGQPVCGYRAVQEQRWLSSGSQRSVQILPECLHSRQVKFINHNITCRSFSGRSLSMPLFVLHSLGYSLTLSVRDVPYFILITIERLYQFRTFWSYFFRITFLFTPCFFSSLLSLYLYFLSGFSFVSFLSFYYEMKSDFDFSILNQMYLKYTFEWFISK